MTATQHKDLILTALWAAQDELSNFVDAGYEVNETVLDLIEKAITERENNH